MHINYELTHLFIIKKCEKCGDICYTPEYVTVCEACSITMKWVTATWFSMVDILNATISYSLLYKRADAKLACEERNSFIFNNPFKLNKH